MEQRSDIVATAGKTRQSVTQKANPKRSFPQRLLLAFAIVLGGIVLNILVYFLLTRIFKVNYILSNAWAWLLYLIFMYASRKYFYFRYTATGFKAKWREFYLFVGLRIGTGILDMILMFVFVSLAGMHSLNAKIIDMLIITALNTILSNFWVFKTQKTGDSVEKS